MTLQEIEKLLLQLQIQVSENTAAITTLSSTISNYATDDDLKAIAEKINILQNNNTVLQNSMATLQNNLNKINFLQKLTDVEINNLTEGDVLQYSNRGKWQNVHATLTGSGGGTGGATSLAGLSDVIISNLSDGQALVYNASSGKWINNVVSGGSSSTGGLTKEQADQLYLSKYGGTIEGTLVVKGLTTIENDLLVKGGITMYYEN